MPPTLTFDDELPTWLYRGVPLGSDEYIDVREIQEVHPPRPDRTGESWRRMHSIGDTNTAYTSWTVDRSIAHEAAEASAGGRPIVVFRVRLSVLDESSLYDGRADEDEILIEGVVQFVEISDGTEEEYD